MCGIWAFLNKNNKDLNILFKNFMNIKHRGPDYSSFQIYNNIIIGFHRLAIMDLSFSSNQPYILKQDDRTIVFVCNGEIYNYQELINNYDLKIDNKSDCLTIPHLYLNMKYNEWIQMFTDEIKGEFAFLLFEFDKSNKLTNLVAGRDALGIRPLYWSETQSLDEEIVFSSEIKGCDFTDLNVTSSFPSISSTHLITGPYLPTIYVLLSSNFISNFVSSFTPSNSLSISLLHLSHNSNHTISPLAILSNDSSILQV
jgi:asparagine synthetase B (glutamine-hydrolysing)